jgi:hypothetical protein
MLRHIIALPILLLCLLSASAPAFACGEVVPTRDCCPNGPNTPCAPEQARTAEANLLDLCCAASGTLATTASAISSNERAKHWNGAAPPAVLVALTTLTTAYVQASSIADFRNPAPTFSDSTLYLSTGRLRL